MMSLEARVHNVVSTVFNRPLSEISAESSPDTIEDWDSLMHISLTLALEEEFGVKFTDEQILKMLNVSLIVLTLQEMGVN